METASPESGQSADATPGNSREWPREKKLEFEIANLENYIGYLKKEYKELIGRPYTSSPAELAPESDFDQLEEMHPAA